MEERSGIEVFFLTFLLKNILELSYDSKIILNIFMRLWDGDSMARLSDVNFDCEDFGRRGAGQLENLSLLMGEVLSLLTGHITWSEGWCPPLPRRCSGF